MKKNIAHACFFLLKKNFVTNFKVCKKKFITSLTTMPNNDQTNPASEEVVIFVVLADRGTTATQWDCLWARSTWPFKISVMDLQLQNSGVCILCGCATFFFIILSKSNFDNLKKCTSLFTYLPPTLQEKGTKYGRIMIEQ